MPCGKNPNLGRLVYDVHKTAIDDRIFPQSAQDQWNDFYHDAEELLPPNMPKPRVFTLMPGPMWMQITLVIWQLGGLIQAY